MLVCDVWGRFGGIVKRKCVWVWGEESGWKCEEDVCVCVCVCVSDMWGRVYRIVKTMCVCVCV